MRQGRAAGLVALKEDFNCIKLSILKAQDKSEASSLLPDPLIHGRSKSTGQCKWVRATLVLANRHRRWLLMRWVCFSLLPVLGGLSHGINDCHIPTGRVQAAMEKTKWAERHTNSPLGGRGEEPFQLQRVLGIFCVCLNAVCLCVISILVHSGIFQSAMNIHECNYKTSMICIFRLFVRYLHTFIAAQNNPLLHSFWWYMITNYST